MYGHSDSVDAIVLKGGCGMQPFRVAGASGGPHALRTPRCRGSGASYDSLRIAGSPLTRLDLRGHAAVEATVPSSVLPEANSTAQRPCGAVVIVRVATEVAGIYSVLVRRGIRLKIRSNATNDQRATGSRPVPPRGERSWGLRRGDERHQHMSGLVAGSIGIRTTISGSSMSDRTVT